MVHSHRQVSSLGVVRGTRKAWTKVGAPLDADDRKLLGAALIWIAGGGVIVVAAAGAAGLAWRVFGMVAGG